MVRNFYQLKRLKQLPVIYSMVKDSGEMELYGDHEENREYFMVLSYRDNGREIEEYIRTHNQEDIKKTGAEVRLFMGEAGRILHIDLPSRNFKTKLFANVIGLFTLIVIAIIIHGQDLFSGSMMYDPGIR